jgi:hypothetical protein
MAPMDKRQAEAILEAERALSDALVQSLTALVDLTRVSAEAALADREAALNAVGDDAQLANVDLQNILQKQQQTLQMMSNISKMLYDTAQSVIRKMGG